MTETLKDPTNLDLESANGTSVVISDSVTGAEIKPNSKLQDSQEVKSSTPLLSCGNNASNEPVVLIEEPHSSHHANPEPVLQVVAADTTSTTVPERPKFGRAKTKGELIKQLQLKKMASLEDGRQTPVMPSPQRSTEEFTVVRTLDIHSDHSVSKDSFDADHAVRLNVSQLNDVTSNRSDNFSNEFCLKINESISNELKNSSVTTSGQVDGAYSKMVSIFFLSCISDVYFNH